MANRRDRRSDVNRAHPDDIAHRLETADLLKAAWAASGMPTKRGFFPSAQRDDVRCETILRFAAESNLSVRFVFAGLEDHIPEELRTPAREESQPEMVARLKVTMRAVRKAMGVPTLEMDRRLEQAYGSYHNWEKKTANFNLTAMQRAVRALGGVFRVELEHKFNPALLKRINGAKSTRAERRQALDQMAADGEDDGLYEATAVPKRTR